jgi:hypothetical protein
MFRGDMRKDIKGMSGDGLREVRDDSNAVLGIRSLICGSVSGWSSIRKSRGRVRT